MKKLLVIALLLSSCHVVKYELAMPTYSYKSHVIKRKHFTFPPDSMYRDWAYYEYNKVPVDIRMDGYSIYRGDTMIHNGVRGGFMLTDTTNGAWEYEWVDSVVNPCTGLIIKGL